MDMISQLPELTQHHILNFLEQEQVFQAALLSKAWRSIVQSHPSLSFCQKTLEQFHKKTTRGGPRKPRLKEPHIFSSNLIDQSLQSKVVVLKFTLTLQHYGSNPSHWSSRLDSWIEHLIKVGVEELKLVCWGCYTLPPALFYSKTLTKLWLNRNLNVDTENCSTVILPNLLDLTLETTSLKDKLFKVFISGCPNLLRLTLITFNFNQDEFQRFISGTPNLETLSIVVRDGGFLSVSVLGLARLGAVRLTGNSFARVEIAAPRLKIFKVFAYQSCAAEVDLIACEATLKVLWLRGVQVTQGDFNRYVCKFSVLHELVLERLSVNNVEIRNKMIRKLEISGCDRLDRVEIDASNMETIGYQGNNLAFLTVKSGSSLRKVESDFPYKWRNFHKFPSWLNNLKELFQNMSRYKDMRLILRYSNSVIVCEEFDESFMKILCDINEKQPWEYMCIVTGECVPSELLFMLRRWKSLYVYLVSSDRKSCEKFLEMAKNKIQQRKEEPDCCKYLHYKCWDHLFYHVKSIQEETAKVLNLFESYETMDRGYVYRIGLYGETFRTEHI